jgi:hypothetical protein
LKVGVPKRRNGYCCCASDILRGTALDTRSAIMIAGAPELSEGTLVRHS